jgi:GNAT superfamily N-acetyltransferase
VIKYCENLSFEPFDLFSARIMATNISYENVPFILNWVETIDNEPVAYLQLYGGTLTIAATDKVDLEEIKKFVSLSGAKFIFCSSSLGFKSSGILMKYCGNKKIGSMREQSFPDYRCLYKKLKNYFDMPPFDEFYTDFSHRVRHNTARVFSDDDYNVIAAIGWETEKIAIVSAVAVDKKLQGKGYGAAAVGSVCSALAGKKIYLYCEKKLSGFYEKCGFDICGEFSLEEIK